MHNFALITVEIDVMIVTDCASTFQVLTFKPSNLLRDAINR